jgi:hypothetical protein
LGITVRLRRWGCQRWVILRYDFPNT